MAYIIGTMRKFRTANFTVIVDALPEDDLDLSWDEDGSVAEGIDSGKYVAFVARARVIMDGEEIGSDYLGGCIYESLESFMDHRECGRENRERARKGETGRCGSQFSGMISEAINEARKHLAKIQRVKVRQVAA